MEIMARVVVVEAEVEVEAAGLTTTTTWGLSQLIRLI